MTRDFERYCDLMVGEIGKVDFKSLPKNKAAILELMLYGAKLLRDENWKDLDLEIGDDRENLNEAMAHLADADGDIRGANQNAVDDKPYVDPNAEHHLTKHDLGLGAVR